MLIFIHRGRNKKTIEISKSFTNLDYNFDYRGKSKFLLLLKAIITSTEIPKADIYLVEGGLCMNVAFFIKLFKSRKAKIILNVIGPLFNNQTSFFSKLWIKLLMKKVDLLIVISKMVLNDAKKFYNGTIEIAHHYVINPKRFKSVTPNLKSKKIIFICERPDETGYIKGLDVVIKIFKKLYKKDSSFKLFLVGSGTERLNFNFPNIFYKGFMNIEDTFNDASILLAPARYDAFPIVVLEAMLAGVIPIISNKVGSKEILKPVDNSLIIEINKINLYVQKILYIVNQKSKIIEDLRIKLYDAAKYFTKNNIIKEYKTIINKILTKNEY